jgi:hypothetical protein
MRRDDFSGAVVPMFFVFFLLGEGQGLYFSNKPKNVSGQQHLKTLPPVDNFFGEKFFPTITLQLLS